MSEAKKITEAKDATLDTVLGMSGGSLAKATVGHGNGEIVRFVKFPTHSEFRSMDGYAYDGTGNYSYFHALLKWLRSYCGSTAGCFIGTATPNSAGIAIIHLYSGNPTADGLPQSSSGAYFGVGGHYMFRTTNGVFSISYISGTVVTT